MIAQQHCIIGTTGHVSSQLCGQLECRNVKTANSHTLTFIHTNIHINIHRAQECSHFINAHTLTHTGKHTIIHITEPLTQTIPGLCIMHYACIHAHLQSGRHTASCTPTNAPQANRDTKHHDRVTK